MHGFAHMPSDHDGVDHGRGIFTCLPNLSASSVVRGTIRGAGTKVTSTAGIEIIFNLQKRSIGDDSSQVGSEESQTLGLWIRGDELGIVSRRQHPRSSKQSDDVQILVSCGYGTVS